MPLPSHLSSQHRRRRVKPDEIAKCIPEEVVEAAITAAMASGWTSHPSLVRIIVKAALAAWPGMVWHPEGQQRKRHGVTHIILPLKETQNDA